MTEQQIRDGFDRLDGALAAPLDAQERVSRRIAVRRRRRRTGVIGATAVVAVALVGSAVALSGGDDPSGDGLAVDQPPAPRSTLVLTRPDGSTYPFPDVTVSCEPPVPGAGLGPAEGRIWLYSPMEIEGDPESEDARVSAPFVYVEGVVAKLQDGRTFELPIDGPGDSSTTPLTVFVADPHGSGSGRANEVSSSEMAAAGTVRVLEAACDPVPVLRIEVDATLGSEVEQGTLDLAGTAH